MELIDLAKIHCIIAVAPPRNKKKAKKFDWKIVLYSSIHTGIGNMIFINTSSQEESSISFEKLAWRNILINPEVHYEFTNHEGTNKKKATLNQFVYVSRRLKHYFLSHQFSLTVKADLVRYLLLRHTLSRKLFGCLLLLIEFDSVCANLSAIRGQAVIDMITALSANQDV